MPNSIGTCSTTARNVYIFEHMLMDVGTEWLYGPWLQVAAIGPIDPSVGVLRLDRLEDGALDKAAFLCLIVYSL